MALCVTGETLLAVADGRGGVPFRTLADKVRDVHAWCVNLSGVPKVSTLRRPRRTDESVPVVRVICDDGALLRVTPDHKFLLTDGTRRRADELGPGDSLVVLNWRPASPNDFGEIDTFCGRENLADAGGVAAIEAAAVAECVTGRRTLFGDANLARMTPLARKMYEGGAELAGRLGRQFTKREWKRFARARGLRIWVRNCDVGFHTSFIADCAVMAGVPGSAECGNHKVAAVEPAGRADVYGGAVDRYRTYCVGGWEAAPGADGRPRVQFLVTEDGG